MEVLARASDSDAGGVTPAEAAEIAEEAASGVQTGQLLAAAAVGDHDALAVLLAPDGDGDVEVLGDWPDVRGQRQPMTALLLAAAKGQLAAVELLLAAGADPDRDAGPRGADKPQGLTPLMLAAAAGHADVVERLLAAGGRPERVHASTLGTALHRAGHGGHPEVMALLEAAGCDPAQRDAEGRTPAELLARSLEPPASQRAAPVNAAAADAQDSVRQPELGGGGLGRLAWGMSAMAGVVLLAALAVPLLLNPGRRLGLSMRWAAQPPPLQTLGRAGGLAAAGMLLACCLAHGLQELLLRPFFHKLRGRRGPPPTGGAAWCMACTAPPASYLLCGVLVKLQLASAGDPAAATASWSEEGDGDLAGAGAVVAASAVAYLLAPADASRRTTSFGLCMAILVLCGSFFGAAAALQQPPFAQKQAGPQYAFEFGVVPRAMLAAAARLGLSLPMLFVHEVA